MGWQLTETGRKNRSRAPCLEWRGCPTRRWLAVPGWAAGASQLARLGEALAPLRRGHPAEALTLLAASPDAKFSAATLAQVQAASWSGRRDAALDAADEDQVVSRRDDIVRMDDEPGHQELCNREQAVFLDAIRNDRDMTAHVEEAINSLRIVLAADESVRTGQVVLL